MTNKQTNKQTNREDILNVVNYIPLVPSGKYIAKKYFKRSSLIATRHEWYIIDNILDILLVCLFVCLFVITNEILRNSLYFFEYLGIPFIFRNSLYCTTPRPHLWLKPKIVPLGPKFICANKQTDKQTNRQINIPKIYLV